MQTISTRIEARLLTHPDEQLISPRLSYTPQRLTPGDGMPRHRKGPPNRGKRASVITPTPDASARAASGLYPPWDRFEQRPILQAIIQRCVQLSCEASRLPNGSAEQRAIERRIRKLDAYTIAHMYEQPAYTRDAVVRRFAQSLLEAGVRPWERVKKETDEYAKRISVRPRGHPVDYRHRVTEALEIQLATGRHWRDIAAQVDVRQANLVPQVRRLKRLLKAEGIPVTSG